MEELMKDEAFLDAIFSKESTEEVQKLFAEKGVEMTLEEVDGLGAAILKANPDGEEELSEEALDSVAGGLIIWLPRRFPIFFPRPRIGRWPRRRW